MSTIVQLPSEFAFLHGVLTSVISAIRELWTESPDTPTAVARADWLLTISDVRGWAASAVKGQERNIALFGFGSYLMQLISTPLNAESGLRGEYFSWVTDRILGGVKEYQPEVFDWLIKQTKELVVSGVDEGIKELETR